jgi:glyoxylate/hydroxypyruvate reductase A
MAILIDTCLDEWMKDEELEQMLRPKLPETEIRCRKPGNLANSVTMLVTTKLHDGLVRQLPSLKLVQKLGAGVDAIVADPDLPTHVRVCRLRSDQPAREIAEYCVSWVLQDMHHHQHYLGAKSECQWLPRAPVISADTHIGVLGLGHIGARVARYFHHLGFPVSGWSRTAKTIAGVVSLTGDAGLEQILSESDYIASILPSTPATRGLIGSGNLAQMKSGAVLINAGRGDLVDETALLSALDQRQIRGAVLDVFATEPLPADNPLWRHPAVVVTPHVSGWHLGDAFDVIAENYKALCSGTPLLHEVDKTVGY